MHLTRRLAAVLAASLVAVGLTAVTAPMAHAQQTPLPATASPSWQTNGMVRAITTTGGLVFLGGDFTTVRPPGAAAGTNEVARTRLAAVRANTGELVTSFDHQIDGPVRALALSPDGRTLYAGGDFTRVDGQSRSRLAAFDVSSGALTSWAPTTDGKVHSLVASSSYVYAGGTFGMANTVGRRNLTAFNATSGNVRTGFLPVVNSTVYSVALSADSTTLYLAGAFTSVNGDAGRNAAAAVDSTTGATRPLPAATVVPAPSSACTSQGKVVRTDGDSVYFGNEGTGGGCFDGTFAAKQSDGSLKWQSKCLGGTQTVTVLGGLLYTGSHTHDCAGDQPRDPNAFGEIGSADGLSRHLLARSTADGALSYWYPNTDGGIPVAGTLGALGPWSSATDGTRLFVGGEFNAVNGRAQQGFTIFDPSAPPAAPLRPQAPAVVSSADSVTVQVQAPTDLDDVDLVVRLYRDGVRTPIATKAVRSVFWKQPVVTFTDAGVLPGSTHTYAVDAVPAAGGAPSATSASTSVTVGDSSPYAAAVRADAPSLFWRLGEAGGPVTAGSAREATPGVYTGDVVRGQQGAIATDGDASVALDGDQDFVSTTEPVTSPATFSTEAWIRTTTTRGGRIIGFGNSPGGRTTAKGRFATSSSYDKHVYMTNDGRLVFGVYSGSSVTTATSQAFNDGQWHHVVATQGSRGMALYVDGALRATNAETRNEPITGYWRVGGDSLGSWPSAPSSNYFAGALDDVAVYPTALTAAAVSKHYQASGRTPAAGGYVPPADAYGQAVVADGASTYWRLDERSGTAAGDASGSGSAGQYFGTVSRGAAGALQGTGTALALAERSGGVGAGSATAAPSRYSTELWFSSTTRRGGRLVGFGDSRTGTSTTSDRLVYMTNSGQLVFGTRGTSTAAVVTSPRAYNDGRWHHVVATQGDAGMALYVDDILVASSGVTSGARTTGYWRVGGDSLSGWPQQPSSSFFAGTLDEVSVYDTALTAGQVDAHYRAAGRTSADATAPVARITGPLAGQEVYGPTTVTVEATDDRQVASVSLLVDGQQVGTSTSAPYSFPWTATALGTHTLTAVATDSAGNTGSSSTITVVVPEDTTGPTAPTGLVASEVTKTSVALSWTAAEDDRGVAGYRLVRDGVELPGTVAATSATDTGLAAGSTHTYAVRAVDLAGNVGADSAPLDITTVAEPAEPMGVLLSEGWSAGDGAWAPAWATSSAGGGTASSVAGAGVLAHPDTAGAYARALLAGVPARKDSELVFSYAWKQPSASSFFSVYLRGSGGWQNGYRPRNGYGLQFSSGSRTVAVQKNVGGVLSTITSVPSAAAGTGEKQWVRLRVVGSTIQFKTWVDGAAEPASWAWTGEDASVTDAGQLFLALTRAGSNIGDKAVTLDDLQLIG